VFCHLNAIFYGYAFDWNEWDDVGGAHAGMCALMLRKIDYLSGLADTAQYGFHDGLAVTDQRDDAAVVIGIHLAIEEIDAVHFHSFNDCIDFGFVAAFGKIGNALD
jgi:hypothetical protein